jgi:circadian clock protein KaiB
MSERPPKKNGSPRPSRRAPARASRPNGEVDVGVYALRLYIAGQTPRSTAAIANLKKLCDEHLPGRYKLEVVDLMKFPELARDHQILAIPTLVRQLPAPMKKIIGDLSNTERALVGLDLKAVG